MKKLLAMLALVFGIDAFAQPDISVGLTWTPNSEPDIRTYRLYRGEASRSYNWTADTGLATQTRAGGLLPGRTYFFAVTAINLGDLESDYSNEVEFTTPVGEAVTAITGWVAKRASGKVTITWDTPPADQFVMRWRIMWSEKGSTEGQDAWVDSPSFEFAAPHNAIAYVVQIQAEGLQGLGPMQTIDIPKFPDIPVALEIEPDSLKVVYKTSLNGE